MRLGWLSRTGIILTAFGLPAVAIYIDVNETSQALKQREPGMILCATSVSEGPDQNRQARFDECLDSGQLTTSEYRQFMGFAFVMSALSFALAWFLALAVYWSVHWIKAGRVRPVTSE